jgi:hypothetical protein
MKTTLQKTTSGEWLLASALCLFGLGAASVFYQDLVHWFAVPVFLCGVLMMTDAIAWARGKLDLFDAAGILGVAGTHFFFIAPLLQIALDFRTRYVSDLPEDYRPWLGGMAVLNFLGLLLYRRLRTQSFTGRASVRTYSLDYWRFSLLTMFTVTVCLLLQASLVQRFGGVAGFLDTVSSRQGMEGLGMIFMFTETVPIVLFLWVSISLARSGQRSWAILAVAYGTFLILAFLFAGLRGSRSNTIYAAIWGAGVIHFYNRRLNRAIVAMGGVTMVAFMYLYGFYKDFGTDALAMLESSDHWEHVTSRSARGPETLLLADFGRSDVQALILYRLTDGSRDLPLAWGKTYLAALALAIPQSLWPERPAGKTKYITDLEHGTGTFDAGFRKSSRVAGVAGEAMLNFGWMMAIGGFVLLGLAVRLVRRCTFLWAGRDPRGLVVPYMTCLVPICLMFDFDNVFFELVTNLAVPGTLILLSSRHSTKPQPVITFRAVTQSAGVRS